ncbi:MAG: ATP-binding protein [Rhodobacteraceae bacterium]|nr:ATP-binding protein [Paracoccaceae bacterium]
MTEKLAAPDVKANGGDETLVLNRIIKSCQSTVGDLVSELDGKLRTRGFASDQVGDSCVILAEALNNVIEHGYQLEKDGDIAINLSATKECLQILIRDRGPSYRVPEAKTFTEPATDDLEQLPEGGFGWGLIHTLSDKVELRRKNDSNYLKINKFYQM